MSNQNLALCSAPSASFAGSPNPTFFTELRAFLQKNLLHLTLTGTLDIRSLIEQNAKDEKLLEANLGGPDNNRFGVMAKDDAMRDDEHDYYTPNSLEKISKTAQASCSSSTGKCGGKTCKNRGRKRARSSNRPSKKSGGFVSILEVTIIDNLFADRKEFNDDISKRNIEQCEDMNGMFQDAEQFNIEMIKNWDLSRKKADGMFEVRVTGGTTMKWINEKKFHNILLKVAVEEWCEDRSAAKAKYGHISDWNVSEVTSMKDLFYQKDRFNDDISRWNVGQVEDMAAMFQLAREFNQDLSGWNVEKCKNMKLMFNGIKKFASPNPNMDTIVNWELMSEVTSMKDIFADQGEFNEDISRWNVDRVESMNNMFYEAKSFNQDLSGWNVDGVEDMCGMFCLANLFNQDISGWNVDKCTGTRSMFKGAESFNQNLSGWKVEKCTDMS
ncbi:hypothetical protein TL16_g12668 [Triparma laevis f. inornata]|uniref:BspA family leucine-rich repeat surface protein n=1 Tax=Triparma laevis f. inornata TaxID=1714386 RepID=A0A9W7BTQ3_9STRA|nr:hypothetical protein TL16_g12668 [Triparma laevis f. inornata]